MDTKTHEPDEQGTTCDLCGARYDVQQYAHREGAGLLGAEPGRQPLAQLRRCTHPPPPDPSHFLGNEEWRRNEHRAAAPGIGHKLWFQIRPKLGLPRHAIPPLGTLNDLPYHFPSRRACYPWPVLSGSMYVSSQMCPSRSWKPC